MALWLCILASLFGTSSFFVLHVQSVRLCFFNGFEVFKSFPVAMVAHFATVDLVFRSEKKKQGAPAISQFKFDGEASKLVVMM